VSDHAVVVVTDATLFEQAHRVVREVQRHCRDRPDVYCFHRGLTPEQVAALASVPRVRAIPIDELDVREGPLEPHEDPALAPLFYARFECWGERFAGYATVCYLDVDVIVRGDLGPLVRADFAIVAEAGGRSPFLDPDDARLRAALDADGWAHELAGVANAGVFALGRRWRTAEQRALLDRIIERYGEFLRVGDQSVLNLWLHANGLRPALDSRFNCQIVRTLEARGSIAAVRRARVLHFNGLRVDNQRLALRLTSVCLRVPGVGAVLAVAGLRAMLDGYRRRPWVTTLIRRAQRVRGRVPRMRRR
jgi:lipopolysaccharide biosynthesis glycosyltransferase